MFGVLFDVYLLSSGLRPGASCMSRLLDGQEHSYWETMAQNLLNHLTYFVCYKRKKVYFAWESHFYNCTAFKGWEVENTLK